MSEVMRYISHQDPASGSEPTRLAIQECAVPECSAQQVLIKVMAFGVNRADCLQRQGKYPAPAGESDILGLEVAGEVVALGEHASQWQVEDSVCGLVAGGGYAEYVAVNADHLMAIPDTLSFVQAAGLSEVFLTAFQSLFWLAQLQPKENVLIHAGASGVGLAAIQLAKQCGCTVLTTASSAEKLASCQQAGADLLINYQDSDFVAQMKAHKLQANVLLDVVAGEYVNRNLSVLAMDGRIVNLAMLAGRFVEQLDMAKLLGKRAQLIGSTLRNRDDEYKARLIKAFSERFLPLFSAHAATGPLNVNLDTIFAADNIGLAHQRLEANDSKGKFIGVWDETLIKKLS